jgi:phenylalanyl-tRNA synthetase alpha chain
MTLVCYFVIVYITNPLQPVDSSSSIDALLLSAVDTGSIEDSLAWSTLHGFDHQRVIGAVKSLEAEGYVTSEALSTEHLVLSTEAEGFIARGSPEAQLFAALPAEGGLSEAQLIEAFSKEFVGIAKGKAMQHKWIAREPTGLYRRAVAAITRDELVEQLTAIRGGASIEEKVVKDLLKRTLVQKR